MLTKHYNLRKQIDRKMVEEIANLFRNGEVVAFPTETVYGLGADATNERAIQKIFYAKGRPSDNPLIVHVSSKKQLYSLVKEVPPYVALLIDTFSPGPITYVLKNAGKVAPAVTAGLETIGVRIPNHPVALALIEQASLPLAAPSANISGKTSPTKATHVTEDLQGKIAAIVDGGQTNVGIESTVVDCTGEVPLILRPGHITASQIKAVVGECLSYEGEKNEQNPKSPGLKYIHYAPEVPLYVVQKEKIPTIIAKNHAQKKRIALIYQSTSLKKQMVERLIPVRSDERKLAKELYAILRSIDQDYIDLIICEYPTHLDPESAIIDRLKRAATKIID